MVDDAADPGLAALEGLRRPGRFSVRPSTVKLPENPPDQVATIFDFFLRRFPRIPRETWQERFDTGKVWARGEVIDTSTLYSPLLEVHYRREVDREPSVREDFRIVWSNQHLMVVDKPPNLPVTPGGKWVRNCLLHLLLESTGNDTITPLHRLDRLTSGVMMLSLDPQSRSHYAGLFRAGSNVDKTYTAICELKQEPPSRRLILDHHIDRSPDEYWRQVVRPELKSNAHCQVDVLSVEGDMALVRARPSTGRKHQIRVQLAAEGLPILGDPLYGWVRSNNPDDLSQRLWLDAYQLEVSVFPGSAELESLAGLWTSSRSPQEFFQAALRWRTRRHESA